MLVAAALAIVTNYATELQPSWLKDRPAATWSVLLVLVVLSAWLTMSLANTDGSAGGAPKRQWPIFHHRNARLVRCLACGKDRIGTLQAGESGSWKCEKCGRTSIVSVDSSARLTIETSAYGKVRITQRASFRGLLTKVYQTEVLEQPDSIANAHRDAADRPGATSISLAIDGMYKREFRTAFVRGLLRDRRRSVVLWSVALAFLVPWGRPHSLLEFSWHVALGFGVCVVLGFGRLWLAGRHTFNRWTRSREALYCWLQRPEGLALAVVMGPSPWHFEALRVLGGREARMLSVELMIDVCRYADRNELTLSIHASDPDWLIEEMRFKRVPEQLKPGFTTLAREPSSKVPGSRDGRSKKKRAKGSR